MIEMKNLKIIILATTIAVLAVATVGVALAKSNGGSPYYGMMGYSTTDSDDDWWTEMEERMEDHWNEVNEATEGDWWDQMIIEHMDDHLDEVPEEIQDQEWLNDMRTYVEDHVDEVQSQDWFDEMTQFLGEQQSEYDYGYGYHGCH